MPNPLTPSSRGPQQRRRADQMPRNHRLPDIYRQSGIKRDEFEVHGELAREPKLAYLEAALFAADEPLSIRKLATAAGLTDTNEARRQIRMLQDLYELDGSAFQIQEVAGGFQLLSRPVFHRWLARLKHSGHDLRLTSAFAQTLAIIAYRQPIMRADIEAIRGVHCGDVLRLLMEKGLIRIAGRHDSLGRPVLYGTTKKFLQVFGLKGLKDLPQVEQLRAGEVKGQEGQSKTTTNEHGRNTE